MFTDKGCHIHNRNGELVATVSLMNGVYKLNSQEKLIVAVTTSSSAWCRRLKHKLKITKAAEGMDFDKKVEMCKSFTRPAAADRSRPGGTIGSSVTVSSDAYVEMTPSGPSIEHVTRRRHSHCRPAALGVAIEVVRPVARLVA
ncbi:hypothetical protein EVAR_31703_1 [Eumeta japonica]|uniref:Uncharacterized protein n=1 Tax=Eumeta variegata TaxID=151549 RepID=A0A4C1VTW1_EUMVA|nr:hypothetical protein EVAR_31703_1 [Eumeta japonica]